MDSDIKIMLPRLWEPALLRAQAAAGERTMTGFVKALVARQLVQDGYLTGAVMAPEGAPVVASGDEASEPAAAATA